VVVAVVSVPVGKGVGKNQTVLNNGRDGIACEVALVWLR
jgi:hypothetical protein